MRRELLTWQWNDYGAKHRQRTNLLVHIAAVSLFQLSTAAMLAALWRLSVEIALYGVSGAGISLLLQAVGHRLERESPSPFTGPLDFVLRFLAEQWITFPRFILSGQWLRNLRTKEI